MGVDFDPKEYPHTCDQESCDSPSYNSYDGRNGRSYCTNLKCEAFDTERLGEQAKDDLGEVPEIDFKLSVPVKSVMHTDRKRAENQPDDEDLRTIKAAYEQYRKANDHKPLIPIPVGTLAYFDLLYGKDIAREIAKGHAAAQKGDQMVGPIPPSDPIAGQAWMDTSDPLNHVLKVYVDGKHYAVKSMKREAAPGSIAYQMEQVAKQHERQAEAARKSIGQMMEEAYGMNGRKSAQFDYAQQEARIAYQQQEETRYSRATNSTARETLEDYRRWTKEHILPLLSKLEKADSTCRTVESAIGHWDDEIGVGIERLKDVEKKEKKNPLMEGFLGMYHFNEEKDFSHIRPTPMKPMSESPAQASSIFCWSRAAMQSSLGIPASILKATEPLRTADQIREIDRKCREEIVARFKFPSYYTRGAIKP